MMDDDATRSSDSLPTSDEFELVDNSEPKLHISGNKSEEQLKQTLQEILLDIDGDMLDVSPGDSRSIKMKTLQKTTDLNSQKEMKDHLNNVVAAESNGKKNDPCDKLMMYTTSPSPLDDDLMSISTCLADGEYTVFDRILYLGSAVISSPDAYLEIQKNMTILGGQSCTTALQISLSLPVNSEGYVILYERSSSNQIVSFPILQIVRYMSGGPDPDSDLFAFVYSCSQGTIPDAVVFQCHVFRCEVPEAVSKILGHLQSASKTQPKATLPNSDSSFSLEKCSIETSNKNNLFTYVFEATLEFKEEDSRGGYASCPKDKDYFKLRCKLEKSVTMTVQQVSNNKELVIERCFGLLISPGRNVRNSDMQLVELVSFKPANGEKPLYTITGLWDPNEPAFEVLNSETPKDTRVYLTVAADLVIRGIQEPVRFVIETKTKIFPPTERFWYFSKKTLYEQFYLRLREVELDNGGLPVQQVFSVHSTTQLRYKKSSLKLPLSKSKSVPSSPDCPDSSSDDDEPLLSGTGEVSKDCTETELEGWSPVLIKWRQNLPHRPKLLTALVRRSIPEALRGEVWQLLAGCYDHKEIVDIYKTSIVKESPCESMIQRDINRTFPAHEQFRDKSGSGQESLLKICKAYAIYDPEVGYCQGLSFLVAALLLHMPEEQAFGVLVKIMFDYKIRDMFRNSFEELHLKFYQLEKLMHKLMPDLAIHFEDLGIEVHMFASQWFLTLFTAKFPLIAVFFIIDLFLLDGIGVIFQVALSLLTLSKKELLALDFEGILKHFRVSLPKKYRNEDSARLLIQSAVKIKVSQQKLKKCEKEYKALKEQEKYQGDPIRILEQENKRLMDSNFHLERENEDLAQELISTKCQLTNDFIRSEEKVESLTKELQAATITISDLEDEKKRLTVEVVQLKEMCRRELQRTETENNRNANIISEYKQICSQMSVRLEKEQAAMKQNLELLMAKIETCDGCSKHAKSVLPSSLAKSKNGSAEDKVSPQDSEHQTRQLELELAQTKLALVEAECKNQDLMHQLNTALNELQNSKNTWFQKTFSSIREVAKKENAKDKDAV